MFFRSHTRIIFLAAQPPCCGAMCRFIDKTSFAVDSVSQSPVRPLFSAWIACQLVLFYGRTPCRLESSMRTLSHRGCLYSRGFQPAGWDVWSVLALFHRPARCSESLPGARAGLMPALIPLHVGTLDSSGGVACGPFSGNAAAAPASFDLFVTVIGTTGELP